MAQFDDIIKTIDQAVKDFLKKIPATQRAMFDNIDAELRRLDLTSDAKIKATVANLKIVSSIKAKLQKLIVSPEYIQDVKNFVKAFNVITNLQNDYWKSIEITFKPKPLLKQIRIAAISDTVQSLTGSGIGANITDKLTGLLRTNVTSGGSYKALAGELRSQLLSTDTPGLLERYVTSTTITSINQYNRQYTKAVSDDLGFEWYAYQGTEILSSRPFCQAMVESNRYFHVSQIPNLLKGLDAAGGRLKYSDNKTGEIKPVEISAKTGLPAGFIPGTNESNFLINAGGYTCGHQTRPVPERNVPQVDRDIVYNTPAYKRWKG
ncbi:MAG: hypothetical protein H0X33_14145 [Taibaiella sp.]|nr:hypothetical protein [Taibaiella sp.]